MHIHPAHAQSIIRAFVLTSIHNTIIDYLGIGYDVNSTKLTEAIADDNICIR